MRDQTTPPPTTPGPAPGQPDRATLEAHLRDSTIAGAEDAEACGLGMTDQKPWDLTVRVTTATSTATYLIDRWE